MSAQTHTLTERELRILKTARQLPTASYEEIAADIDDFSPAVDEVEEVVENHTLPEEYGSNGKYEIPPTADTDKVRETLRNNPDVRDAAIRGERGFTSMVNNAIKERYGEQFEPSTVSATISNIVKEFREETREDEEEDKIHEAVTGNGPSTSGVDRARKVLLDDGELLERAAEDGEEAIEDVKERVKEEFGFYLTPTDNSVRRAISELRVDGTLPPLGEGKSLKDSSPSAKITYTCQLCGFSDSDSSVVKHHITNKDDPVHANRNGREAHLVRATGKETETEVFEQSENGEVHDHFELVWAIYQNPSATQGELSKLINISQSTLHNWVDDLGIDWDDREEEVEELLAELQGGGTNTVETIDRAIGNRSYIGPETGLDLTTTHLSEVNNGSSKPDTDADMVTVEVSSDEAYRFVVGDEDAATSLRELVLTQLFDDDISPPF